MTGRVCNKAVILAAGCGSRIRSLTTGNPKCLMELGGRPIIEWIFSALRAAGIVEVVMVIGYKGRMLRRTLGSGARYGLRLRYVHNPRWTEPNGVSLQAARRALRGDDTFLVLMSDHLLPASIIKRVARARLSGCVLAVDTRISRIFDLSDATKVRLTGGVPVAIGKRLRKYNAVDCGLFRFDRRVFAALDAAIRGGSKSLTEAIKILIADGDLDVLPVGDDVCWIDVDTPKAYRQAAADVARFTGTGKSAARDRPKRNRKQPNAAGKRRGDPVRE